MSPLLKKIINECPEHLRKLLEESATEIDADFATVVECAADDDGKPKLVLSFAITINTDEHGVNNKLSWSVKKKAESCFKIDDANQPNLPGTEGVSVTLSSGGKSVTLDSEAAGRIKNAIEKNAPTDFRRDEDGDPLSKPLASAMGTIGKAIGKKGK